MAQAYFVEQWKPGVRRAPDFYGLVGVDISDAMLAAPFREFILREDAVRRFADSSDADPRPYWTLERYAFPIIVENAVVGSILIQRNRDENERKFEERAGDYFFWGVTFNGNEVDRLMLDLRARTPGANIEWVQFVGSNVVPRIVVQTADGDVFSGPLGERSVPIADDALRVKNALRKEAASQ